MTDRMLMAGNEAVGWGAVNAGCDGFFGYPITPQNSVIEWFAREMPVRGKVFVQTPSETSSIMMVYGGAAAGRRVMTSTSGPGWSLMQEGMSHLAAADLPAVIVITQRGGPGQGSVRHAQMDYLSVTRGGGNGGYKNIVLAPASVQEVHDLMQLAFYLADKYANPVVVLSDAIIGLISETVEMKPLEFGPVPDKKWAVKGRANHSEKVMRRMVHSSVAAGKPLEGYTTYLSWMKHKDDKYKTISATEVRYEAYRTDEVDLVIVAYGYASRICKEAINRARAEGLKVGMIRPVSLWPFPTQPIREIAQAGCKVLVVEDSLGQMIDDVNAAVPDRSDVHFIGMFDRHQPDDSGMILPNAVLDEIRRML
jgi:2-oxoglutarate ferredoxin oxidoreductase subunit alpha